MLIKSMFAKFYLHKWNGRICFASISSDRQISIYLLRRTCLGCRQSLTLIAESSLCYQKITKGPKFLHGTAKILSLRWANTHFVNFVMLRLILRLKLIPVKNNMGRAKRIWYLSPMRAAKVQASLRIRAVSPEPSLLAHTSSESRGTFRQKSQIPGPSEWLGMRS